MPTSRPIRRAAAITTTAAVAALAAGLGAFGIASANAAPAFPSSVDLTGAGTRGIAAHDGALYVSERWSRQIERMDTAGTTTPIVSIPDASPAAVALDQDGDVFFTVDSDAGIYEIPAADVPTDGTVLTADAAYRSGHRAFTAPSRYTYALAFDAAGDLFYDVYGTGSGDASVGEFAAGSTAPTTVLGGLTDVSALTVGPTGDLWIGTEDGRVRSLAASALVPASYPRAATELVTRPVNVPSYTTDVFGLAFVDADDFFVSGGDSLERYTLPSTTPDPTATATPTESPTPTDTATPTPTSVPVTAPVYPTQTTSGMPKVYTVTAGTPFSLDLTAGAGTPTPVYTIESVDHEDGTLADGLSFDEGILSGTTTDGYPEDYLVTATNSAGSTREWVELDVLAGPVAGIDVEVGPKSADGSVNSGWDVGPDGVEGGFSYGDGDSGGFDDAITATQGQTFAITAYEVDRWDNVIGADGDGDPAIDPTVTSSVSTDTITANAADETTEVTFVHASPHTITVSADGFSTSFTVQVSPLAVVTPPTTIATPAAATTVTAAAAQPRGHRLASTGSDAGGPLGWALALIVAGAMVTVVRVRRRRSGR